MGRRQLVWSRRAEVVGNGTVFALATMGNNLYAGGSFTNMGGVPATRIAKWDGANWSALGTGVFRFRLQPGGNWVESLCRREL